MWKPYPRKKANPGPAARRRSSDGKGFYIKGFYIMTFRSSTVVLAAGLLTAFAQSPQAAASPQHATHKKAAVPPAAVPPTPCAADATLSFSGTSASQGGLLLATLSAKSPLTAVQAKWDTQEISFWQSAQAASAVARPQIWHALVPVDLEKPPGDYAFAVDLQPPPTPTS